MMPNDERMARPIERSGMLYGGRWIACAGLVYVVAWLIGLAIGFGSSSPGPTDSVETIGAYFSTHREAAMLQAYLTQGIAGAALLIFAAALANALRRFEGDGATVSTIAFGAGVAAAGVSLIEGLFAQVLADRVASMGDAATNRALFDLNYQSDTYKLLAMGLFIGLVAILVLRTGALPRWLGWLGVVLSPLLVIAGWSFVLSTSVQYAAYAVLLVALLVWVAAVSVVSWQRAAARGAVPERVQTRAEGQPVSV